MELPSFVDVGDAERLSDMVLSLVFAH